MYATKPSPKQLSFGPPQVPGRPQRTGWRTVVAHLGPVLSSLRLALQGPQTSKARSYDKIQAESGHLSV